MQIFWILMFGFISGCGHGESYLSGSQNVPQNFSQSNAVPLNEETLTLFAASGTAGKEYDSAPGRANAGFTYTSPFTAVWKSRLISKTGLSGAEVGELYRSSRWGSLLRLPAAFQSEWDRYLGMLWVDRWFFTRCRDCLFSKNISMGTLKQFLTGEFTTPQNIGRGSFPAAAYDPFRKNYLIVWDESGANGRMDIYAKLVGDDGTTLRVDRKRISIDRPRHGCLFREFAEVTGLTAPNDCKINVEPSAAYNDGKFLITWTEKGNAAAPRGAKFSVVLGMLVDAETLEPAGENWSEGVLLSKITYASADPAEPARNDRELQSWSLNEHSQVIPILGEDRARGSFLMVWDTTKDFISCRDAARRTATSIYGRAVPADFNPNRDGWANNPDIFPIYTDPSTVQPRCAPNDDVDRARKPRAAVLNLQGTFNVVAVFEISKNVVGTLPSIGASLVTLQNDLRQNVGNIYNFEPVDNQLHEGCYDPDIVSATDRFLLADSIGLERLKLTPMVLNRGNIILAEGEIYSAPENARVVRPRLVTNRPSVYPLEYVVAYEARPADVNSMQFPLQVVGFDASLHAMEPRILLQAEGFPTNQNAALAGAGEKMLAVWNGVNGQESRIFDSVVTINEPPLVNRRPAAVITVEGHPENPPLLTSGEAVVFSGEESSDPDGDLLTYRWRQVGGSFGVFADDDASRTNFTPPDVEEPGDIIIQLTVTDEEGLASAPVRKTMRVLPPPPPPNNAPQARVMVAGGDGQPIQELAVEESAAEALVDPQTGLASWPPTRVTLSGAASDDGEDPASSDTLRFSWAQVGADGTNNISQPSDPNRVEFSFDVPDVSAVEQSKEIVIRLTVDDGGDVNNISTQDIRITVRAVNHHPVGPRLLSPAEGELIPSTHGLLTWEAAQDPDAVGDGEALNYEVIFEGAAPPQFNCRRIAERRCLLLSVRPNTVYRWKVRVRDSSAFAADSETKNFTTDQAGFLARWLFNEGQNGLCGGFPAERRGRSVCDTGGGNWHGVFYPRGDLLNGNWLVSGNQFNGEGINGILEMALGLNNGDSVIISGFKLENIDQASFEFWVYPQRFTAAARHLLFQIVQGQNNLRAVIVEYDGDTGHVHLTLNTSNDNPNQDRVLESSEPVLLNQWNHVVCSFGPNGRRIFINGRLASPPAGDGAVFGEYGGGEAILGWNSLSQGEPDISPDYLRGVLDEIVIYNRELSPELIEKMGRAH